SSFDLLGHGLRRAPATPAGDVTGKRAGATAGGHDQNIIRRLHERAELRLVAVLDRAGHALGPLEMGERILRVLPHEVSDLLLAPAAGGNRAHVLAGQDDHVLGLAHHVAGHAHVVGQRGPNRLSPALTSSALAMGPLTIISTPAPPVDVPGP